MDDELWFSSDDAKRRFGGLCTQVNTSGTAISLLGTRAKPLLRLVDADFDEEQPGDTEISIEEAKADWPGVTTAASVYGTRFRVRGKRVVRAVLFKHPKGVHPAEAYRRSSSVEINEFATILEDLAQKIRRLDYISDRLGTDLDRFDQVADVLERRFRQVWRASNNDVALPSHDHLTN